MASEEIPTYTIIQADGLYPDDDVENKLFAPNAGQKYHVNYVQTGLYPSMATVMRPWSDIPEDLRNQVDGIEVLKMPFSAAQQMSNYFPG